MVLPRPEYCGCASWVAAAPATRNRQCPSRPTAAKSAATSSDISADEEVVFFPTAAHFDASNSHWIVPIHGCIYEPEQDSQKRGVVVASMRRAAGVEEGSPEAQRLDQRVRLFLVDNERGQKISIRLGAELYEVGTSGPNGHFQADLRIPATSIEELQSRPESPDGFVSFSAVTRDTDARSFTGRVQAVPPEGMSIISDIDDTIKHTQVGDRRAVVANTFLHEFQPVPGMPELYRQWAQQGIVFHYVSGSPWQLYLPLAEFFRTQQFPAGSMDLKLFRLKDPSALDLLQSQTATKIRAIEPLLAAFPQRRFVLIGDSGEQDPEIYTETRADSSAADRGRVHPQCYRRATGRCALPHLTTGTRGRAVSTVRAGGRTAAHHGRNQSVGRRASRNAGVCCLRVVALRQCHTHFLQRPDDRRAAQIIEIRVNG